MNIIFYLLLSVLNVNSAGKTGTVNTKTVFYSDLAKRKQSDSANIKSVQSNKTFMSKHKTAFTAGVYTFVPAITTLLGMQMWEWGDETHFKARSDGWFQRTTTHGGADKTGHMYTFYLETKVFSAYFDKVYPYNHKKAVYLGSLLAFLSGIAVEIGDGYASDFGFSYPDVVFDSIGVALAMMQELWPAFDDLIDVSCSFLFSPGFWGKQNENHTDVATDYSGQLQTIHLRLGGIPVLKHSFLRYLRMDFGYFTRNYQPYDPFSYENTATNYYETRNLYFGFSFDLARMLKDSYGRKNKVVNAVSAFSRIYNIWGLTPFGVNFDLNHGFKAEFGTNTITP